MDAALTPAATAALPFATITIDDDGDAVVAVSALDLATEAPELGQAAMDDPGLGGGEGEGGRVELSAAPSPRSPRSLSFPLPDAVNAAFTSALAVQGVARAFVRAHSVPLPAVPATPCGLRAALAGRWSAPAAVTGVVISTLLEQRPYSRTLVCPTCGAAAVDAPGARARAPCACGAGAVVDEAATTYATYVSATMVPVCAGSGMTEEVVVQAVGGDVVAELALGACVHVMGVVSLTPAVRVVCAPRGLGGVTAPVLKAACVSVPAAPRAVSSPPSLDALIAATRAAGAGRAPCDVVLVALLLSVASVGAGRAVHVGVRGARASALAALARVLAPIVTTPAMGSMLPSIDAATGATQAGALATGRGGVCVIGAVRIPPAALAAVLAAADTGSAHVKVHAGAARRDPVPTDGSMWCVDPPVVSGGARRGASATTATAAARATLDVTLPWVDHDDDAADMDDVLLGAPSASMSLDALTGVLCSAAASSPPRVLPATGAALAAYYAAARATGAATRGGGHYMDTLARLAAAPARLHGRGAATHVNASVAAAVADAAAATRVLPKLDAPFGVVIESVAEALDVLVARAGVRARWEE